MFILRQRGPLDFIRPAAFRPPLTKGLALSRTTLDTSTEMNICQCFRWGILRVYANEFGLKIDVLLKMETS